MPDTKPAPTDPQAARDNGVHLDHTGSRHLTTVNGASGTLAP
jgi:hypothetical protein